MNTAKKEITNPTFFCHHLVSDAVIGILITSNMFPEPSQIVLTGKITFRHPSGDICEYTASVQPEGLKSSDVQVAMVCVALPLNETSDE
jgi:hypothetical protein